MAHYFHFVVMTSLFMLQGIKAPAACWEVINAELKNV